MKKCRKSRSLSGGSHEINRISCIKWEISLQKGFPISIDCNKMSGHQLNLRHKEHLTVCRKMRTQGMLKGEYGATIKRKTQ